METSSSSPLYSCSEGSSVTGLAFRLSLITQLLCVEVVMQEIKSMLSFLGTKFSCLQAALSGGELGG